jgi:hypothetical protein
LVVTVGLIIISIILSSCKTSGDFDGNSQDGNINSEGRIETDTELEDSDNADSSAIDTDGGTDLVTMAQTAWDSSPHASTFVVDDLNQNNTCARCHSPLNWMPTMADIPPSCQACKFELADPPPYIPESEWAGITCLMCHQENKKGEIQPEVFWLEIPVLEEYAEVEDNSDLCLKCHQTNNVPNHGMVIVGGDHTGMLCTDCHHRHTAEASCETSDCHPGVTGNNQIPGHDEAHLNLTCAACHDSAGWEIGFDEENNIFLTMSPWSHEHLISEENSVLETGLVPFSSHDISLEVNCDRCHFAGNEWDLIVDIVQP